MKNKILVLASLFIMLGVVNGAQPVKVVEEAKVVVEENVVLQGYCRVKPLKGVCARLDGFAKLVGVTNEERAGAMFMMGMAGYPSFTDFDVEANVGVFIYDDPKTAREPDVYGMAKVKAGGQFEVMVQMFGLESLRVGEWLLLGKKGSDLESIKKGHFLNMRMVCEMKQLRDIEVGLVGKDGLVGYLDSVGPMVGESVVDYVRNVDNLRISFDLNDEKVECEGILEVVLGGPESKFLSAKVENKSPEYLKYFGGKEVSGFSVAYFNAEATRVYLRERLLPIVKTFMGVSGADEAEAKSIEEMLLSLDDVFAKSSGVRTVVFYGGDMLQITDGRFQESDLKRLLARVESMGLPQKALVLGPRGKDSVTGVNMYVLAHQVDPKKGVNVGLVYSAVYEGRWLVARTEATLKKGLKVLKEKRVVKNSLHKPSVTERDGTMGYGSLRIGELMGPAMMSLGEDAKWMKQFPLMTYLMKVRKDEVTMLYRMKSADLGKFVRGLREAMAEKAAAALKAKEVSANAAAVAEEK